LRPSKLAYTKKQELLAYVNSLSPRYLTCARCIYCAPCVLRVSGLTEAAEHGTSPAEPRAAYAADTKFSAGGS
jgi:hypothetical protein